MKTARRYREREVAVEVERERVTGEWNGRRGEKQVGKRDTLPVTGGKDLGKRKGVAND